MKNKLLSLIIFCFGVISLKSQVIDDSSQGMNNLVIFKPDHTGRAFTGIVPADTILFRKGKAYYQGNRLSNTGLTALLKTNETAYKKYQGSKPLAFISYVLAFAGGYCIGTPIGQFIAGGEPQWGLAAIGTGCFAIAFPLAITSDKKKKESIYIYNRAAKYKQPVNLDLRFTFEATGIGLTLRF